MWERAEVFEISGLGRLRTSMRTSGATGHSAFIFAACSLERIFPAALPWLRAVECPICDVKHRVCQLAKDNNPH